MSLIVDIRKRLGGFSLDVAFEAANGVTGLLGASGSGKSMTLMCVAGVVKPDSGKIILDGVTLFDSARRVNLPPQKRRVGYLFQRCALFPHMTVRQNIMCVQKQKSSRVERERELNDILGLMQLDGLENRKPDELSGGQRQRAALARILVSDPSIIMLDEPFAALDSHLREKLQIDAQKLLSKFCATGKTALLVTHDRDEAYRMCGRLVLLDNGRVLAHKGTKALFNDPESVSAALLTGCKNVVAARKTGEYEVEIPAWGIRLTTALPLRGGLCAVAIRAHSFSLKEEANRFPARVTRDIEEPFEQTVQFRYNYQAGDSPDVWWRLPKEDAQNLPSELGLGVKPVHVLPLYTT